MMFCMSYIKIFCLKFVRIESTTKIVLLKFLHDKSLKQKVSVSGFSESKFVRPILELVATVLSIFLLFIKLKKILIFMSHWNYIEYKIYLRIKRIKYPNLIIRASWKRLYNFLIVLPAGLQGRNVFLMVYFFILYMNLQNLYVDIYLE